MEERGRASRRKKEREREGEGELVGEREGGRVIDKERRMEFY